MNDVFEGLANPFDDNTVRISNLERFLEPFSKVEITAETTAAGTRKLDVLARIGLLAGSSGPFVPSFSYADGAITVSVSPGVDVDHDPTATIDEDSDALIYYEVPAYSGSIVSGQAVYVLVKTLPTGAIGTTEVGAEPCAIFIGDDGIASVNPVPASEEELSGIAGSYYYKLAVVTADSEGTLSVANFLSGENIHQRRTSSANLNLSIYGSEPNAGILCWRNGLFAGADLLDAPSNLVTKTVLGPA